MGTRPRIIAKLAITAIVSLLISLIPAVPHHASASAAVPLDPAVLAPMGAPPGDLSLLSAGPVTWPIPMRGARRTHPFTEPPPELGPAVGGAVGPAGGVVRSDDDQLALTLPLGALSAPATVSIQRRVVPEWPSVPHAFFWVELSAWNERKEPVHRFAVPVQLALHVPSGLLARLSVGEVLPAQPEDVRWWQYDEERQEWLPQPAHYDASSSTLYVKLDHFSHGAAGSDPDAQPQTIGGLDGYATDLFTGWPIASYPFAIPPGTAGMAPDMALRYFGGAADTTAHVPDPKPTTQADFAGFGWSLDPGRISRAADGVGFSLNLAGRSGSLRLNKAEATGGSGTLDGRYHTDPEHFAKIDHLWRAVALPGPHSWVQVGEWVDSDFGSHWASYGTRSGTWGDVVTFSFTGTSVSWDTQRGSDQGKADVFIDGVLQAQVDNYAACCGLIPATYTYSGLAAGAHTIVIAVTGQKSSSATAAYVFVRDFIVNGVATIDSQLAPSAWSAGWIADHWVATTTDGTQYRFGYDLPAEVYAYPQPTGLRTSGGSHQWELVPPGTAGTKLIRRGETYLLDQITDLRGDRITFAYDISLADLSVAGSPLSSYARAAYVRDVRYTLHTTSPLAGQRRVQIDRQPRAMGPTKDYESDAEYDARVGAGASASTQRFFADQRPLYLRADVCASSCTYETSWTPAYKYAFTHSYLASTNTGAQSYKNRLLLGSVQPLDPNSTGTLSATTFQYNDQTGTEGALSFVSNGYGGDTTFTYTTYSAGGNASYPYWHVTTMTRRSGMVTAGVTESFATNFAYGASTLLGTTPGHAFATATDSLGVVYHEFVATADPRDTTRPGLRGRETRTVYQSSSGAVVDETIRTYGLRRSARALDPTSGAETVSESESIELRALERWSSENAGKQVTRSEYAYDQFGNVIRTTEYGDSATSTDDRTTASVMLPSASLWLLDRPQATTLYQHAAPTATEITGSGQPAADGILNWCAWWYQSFTAPATGVLAQVQPFLYRGAGLSGNAVLSMRILADAGGAPGTLLGSTSALPSAVPLWTGSAPTPFDLDVSADGTVPWSAPVRVSGGQLYWVGLSAPTDPTGVAWVGTTVNTYTRGSALARNSSGTTCVMPDIGPDLNPHPAPMPVDLAMKVSVLPDLGDAATPAVAQTQFAYDGQAYGSAPTQGLATWIQRLDAQAGSIKEVDLHTYDASGNRTQTIWLYDPAGGDSADARNPRTNWTYDPTYRTFAAQIDVRAKDLGGGSFLTLSTTRQFDDKSGVLTSQTDPNNATTTYGYDNFYRLSTVWRPGEASTPTQRFEYFYGSVPNRLLVTSKDGSVATDGGLHTILFYDGLGRLIETKSEIADNVNGAGTHSVLRRLYTDRGLLHKEYAPWGTPAQSSADFLSKFEYVESASPVQPSSAYQYDPAGRLSQATGTDGASVATTYGDGLVTVVDQLGHQTKRYRDGFARLAKVEEYTGTSTYALYATTTYSYNFQDLLTQITDTAAKTTTYTYDGLGRRRTQSEPDAGSWSYSYDGLGRPSSWTDAKGQRIDLAYDNASRTTQRSGTPPGGSTTTLATFGYDAGGAAAYALGRRTSISDASGSTTYTYDSRGRVTQLAQAILGSAYTTGFSYDSLDRASTMTYPDGEIVNTSYGANGLPSSLVGTSTYVSSATYTPLFRPLQITYGSGSLASFDYYDTPNKTDYAGSPQPSDFRLRRISYQATGGAVRQQHDYRYDRAGNVTKWWQQDESAVLHDWTFGYDDLDRLTSAAVTNAPTGQPASFAYAYDQLGRITSGPLGTYSYGDPNHEHAATAAGSNSYAYDANGALTGRTESAVAYSHSYDLLSQLTQVGVGGANNGFVYDGDGQLVARTTNGNATLHYAAGGLYEKDLSTGIATKLYRFGGRLVAVRDSALHFIGQDHLGSTTLQWTANEMVEGAQLRAPYGAPWYASGSLATDRRYTDQRSLEGTLGSLYHYGARQYSPVLGRFTSPDSLAPSAARSLDAYGYARANPLRRIDPSGLSDVATDSGDGTDCTDVECAPDDNTVVTTTPATGSTSTPGGGTGPTLSSGTTPSTGPTPGATPSTGTTGTPSSSQSPTPGSSSQPPAAQPAANPAASNPGSTVAYAVAGVFGDLGSPDLATQAGATAKVAVAGIAIAVPIGIAATPAIVGGAAAATGTGGAAAATAAAGVTLWPAAVNGAAVINGVTFTAHALVRMSPYGLFQQGSQIVGRGVPPSAVLNALANGQQLPGSNGSVLYEFQNVVVAANAAATKVFTVWTTGH